MFRDDFNRNGISDFATVTTAQSVGRLMQAEIDGFSFNGSLYQLTSRAFTWEEAQAEAIRLGGNLVTINDATEQLWLEETFGTTETFWTGLTDQGNEGTFAWVNEEAVAFTQWGAGQPQQDPFAREYAEREDYVTLHYERTPFWADSDGSARYRGMIEVENFGSGDDIGNDTDNSGSSGDGIGSYSPQGSNVFNPGLSEIIFRGDTAQPQLFLTFDDGPIGEQTTEILDVLDQFEVKASFFLVGREVEAFPQEARRIVDSGHVVGNHSFFHADNPNPDTGEVEGLRGISQAEVHDELQRTQATIQSITGQTPQYFRPPFGYWNNQVHRASDELGLTFVDISEQGDTEDWKIETPVTEVVDILLNNAANGYIFVMHDHGRATADALRIALPQLLDQGFEFATLDELPA